MSFQDSLVRTKETNMTENNQERKLTGRKDSIVSKRSVSNNGGLSRKVSAKRDVVATATTGESGDSLHHTKTEPTIQMPNSNRNADEKQINIITNRKKSKSKKQTPAPVKPLTIEDLQHMDYATLNKEAKNQED